MLRGTPQPVGRDRVRPDDSRLEPERVYGGLDVSQLVQFGRGALFFRVDSWGVGTFHHAGKGDVRHDDDWRCRG